MLHSVAEGGGLRVELGDEGTQRSVAISSLSSIADGAGQKCLPGNVPGIVEGDRHAWIGMRANRSRKQFHGRLNWRPSTLFAVARGAGAHDILPSGPTALRTRYYVVET